MTEIDTSREAVEAMAQYYAGWARDIRAQGIHSEDAIYRDKTADTIRALLDRAEKAEAERDTVWNDAIEAAERVVRCYGIPRDVFDAHMGNPRPALAEAIRALRK